MRFLAVVSCLVLTLLFTSYHSLSTYALSAPPAKLAGETVSPTCITTETSFLHDQTPGYGTGNKGPAIVLANNCPVDIVITDIKTSISEAEDKKSVPQVDTRLRPNFKKDINTFKDYIFAGNSDGCKLAILKLEKELQIRKYVACSGISVPADGSITIAIPWKTFYVISGHSEKQNSSTKEEKFDVLVEGKMINPEDKSPSNTNINPLTPKP